MKNTTKTQINKILKSEIFSPFFGMFMLGICYVCGFLFGGISVNELFTLLGYVVLAAIVFGSLYSMSMLLDKQIFNKQPKSDTHQ